VIIFLISGLIAIYLRSNPVMEITLFKSPIGIYSQIVPGPWELNPSRNPHRTHVWFVLTSSETADTGLFAGLVMEKYMVGSITFSRYTFYNRATKKETEIDGSGQYGPYKAGQVVLLGGIYPWSVPSEPGTYEFRVYLGKKIVASALFEVQ
jgi:hypothetical protein